MLGKDGRIGKGPVLVMETDNRAASSRGHECILEPDWMGHPQRIQTREDVGDRDSKREEACCRADGGGSVVKHSG